MPAMIFGRTPLTPEAFASELAGLCGPSLESVILFGSAASGEFRERHSDLNLAVVLKRAGLEELKAASPAVRRWLRAGHPAPLFLTPDWFETSSDVFPIELLDMKDRHKVLYGSDPLAGLKVDPRNLRYQLEHELKGKLLKLRGRFVQSGGRPGELRDLLSTAGSTFQILFQAALRLYGASNPPAKSEAARELAKRIEFDPAVFDHIHRLRRGEQDALGEPPEPWIGRLIEAVERVERAIGGGR